VEAPPGSFEPGASVLILNNTNGIVLSGVVHPDGGFSFQIRAAITDELQIRIVDSADREVVIEKTEYRAADGSVAIGTKGGKVAAGEFVLEVPEGALDGAAIFQLRPLTQEEIDALPLPEGAGGLGSGVEVDIGESRLQEEADLSFPVPFDAPPDADFLIVRKVEVDDLILYETIDSASVQDGKIVTDSFPFLGVLVTGVYQPIWFPPLAATGKSPLGVITGIARESDGNPVKPTIVPLPDVVVSADKNLGLGDYTATTAADGRFTLWDVHFGSTGGTVNVVATDPKDREVRAIAFESPGLFSEFPALARYNKAGEVVFNFDLSPPPPPPPAVTVRLFRENTDGDEVEIKNGFAAAGEELLIRLNFTSPPSQTNASINGVSVVVEKVDGFNFLIRFTPPDARSYTLTGSAIDAFFRQITFSKSFLGVAGGGGNEEPLPGPPSVISDASIPRPEQAGVGVSDVFQIIFSEPVMHVVPSAVRLQTLGGTLVPIEMIGSGPEGVAPVEPDDVITALTIRTQKGLEFSNQYQFVLTGAIVDIDEDPPGTPAPNPLNPDPTVINFSTFTPEILGQVDVEEGIGAAILRERAYVLRNTFPASVRTFDISDPSNPVRFGQEDNFVFGIARQILAGENVDLGQGATDLVATFSINTFSGQGILTVLDVGRGDLPPFPWAAVVTLSGTGEATLGVDLHRNFAYAAASDRGLKVFDLTRAAERYRATKKPTEKDPGFAIQKLLFTKGQGFAQEALVRTIPLTAPGGTLRASAVKAGESVLGRVAYVGSFLPTDAVGYFSSVNVSGGVAIPVLATLRLEKDGLTMGTPSRIGLTRVGDQDLAVAVGGDGFAIIDVTDPENPVILSLNELQGSSGRSVSFNGAGTTVFLGTSAGLEAYNLSDPVVPEFAGVLSDLAVSFGDSGVAEDLAFSVDGDGGLKLAALGVIPLVVTDPPILVTDDAQRVVQPGRFLLQVVPPTFEVATAEVELLAADIVTETIPGVFGAGGFGEAPFDKGLSVPPTDPRMQLIVNRGTQDDRRSGRVSVPTVPLLTVEPTVTLRLEVDPINETTCLLSVDPIVYYLALPAKVTISLIIDGQETVIFSANQTPGDVIPEQFVHHISQFGLFPPASETHEFRVVAELLEDPTVVAERLGQVQVDARAHNVLPVGHTFVKGVDLLDGHLVSSSTDVSIPGRGPALEVVRTYSSAGSSSEGPFGAGWSLNYFSTLIVTDCFWTIVGGDGSGQRFLREGNTFIPQKGYHTELRENPDGSFDFFTKGRVRFHYLDIPLFEGDRLYGGRPTLDYIEDPNGNRIQIFYDANRNIIEAREIFADGTEGRSLHFEYIDVLGFPRVERITGPLSLEILYEYDAFANLERVTRDERVETYEYSLDKDDRHNLVAMTDANGNRTEYVYYGEGEVFPGEQTDELGQGRFEWVKEVREPEGTTTSFVYDLTDLIATGFFKTFVTDARGNVTEYQLNRNGSPELIVEPGPMGPIVTEMEWAVDDITKIEEIDANGRRTRFVYDDNANLTREIIETADFGEIFTQFSYDPVFNKMTSKTDAEGRVTEFEIDSTNGNLLSVTDAEGNVSRFEYDELGDLRQQIDPRDGVTVFTYDVFGNQETLTDPLGNVTRTVYDARSRIRSTTDDFGRSATMDYDELDRVTVVERTDAKGSSPRPSCGPTTPVARSRPGPTVSIIRRPSSWTA
jgi:YD repeat-containing protein